MLKKCKEKLHSKSGVSILLALLLFLVASMVSVSILDSAVTTARRVHEDKLTTQDRLAMRSAAEVFEKELKSVQVTIRRTSVTTTTFTPPDSTVVDPSTPIYDLVFTGNGTMASAIETAFESVYTSNPYITRSPYSTYDHSANLTVSVDGSVEDSFKDVTVSFTMQPYVDPSVDPSAAIEDNYKIVARFVTSDASEVLYMTAIWGNQAGFTNVSSNSTSDTDGEGVTTTVETDIDERYVSWTEFHFSQTEPEGY